MRFFTREFYQKKYHGDELELEALKDTYADAAKHLENLNLAPELKAIADPFYVDDALIARVRQGDYPPKLSVELRRGNLQIGYSDLAFDYVSPEVDDASLSALYQVADRTKSARRHYGMDAYCQEFDIEPDGRVVHSIIFHGDSESGPFVVTVRCQSLKVRERPQDDRDLPPFRERYRIERLNASSVTSP